MMSILIRMEIVSLQTIFKGVQKVTVILGISAFYHDSAAAIIKDGNIIAAAQEERFTRKKHDSAIPLMQ